jgi:hypothetical protein
MADKALVVHHYDFDDLLVGAGFIRLRRIPTKYSANNLIPT